jgi:hypothetical protein
VNVEVDELGRQCRCPCRVGVSDERRLILSAAYGEVNWRHGDWLAFRGVPVPLLVPAAAPTYALCFQFSVIRSGMRRK